MRLNVDIATLQETRLAVPGALKGKDYAFYWQGKGSGEHKEYVVGFAVRNSLLSMIEPDSNGSERVSPGFLETPALKALAPIGSDRSQACRSQERSTHTRSYHSADCNTDHSLICCRIRLQPKRFHRTKKQGSPRIDVSKMSQPNLMSQFAEVLEGEFGAPKTLP